MTVLTYEKIECAICHKKFAKLGLARHVTKNHGISSKEYRIRFVKKIPCEICGTLTYNVRFCGKRCTNIYRSNLRFSPNKRKDYVILTDDIKPLLIDGYMKEYKSMTALSEEFNIDKAEVSLFFKSIGIKFKSVSSYVQRNHVERLRYLSQSPLGQEIIKEYTSFGGNLRALSKKFNLNRVTIKKMLSLSGIPIKDSKKAKAEVIFNRIKSGIRSSTFRKATTGGKANWYYYKGIKYQGSWEFKMGLWLESKNIEFLCHEGVKRFEYEIDGITYTYCPDFYLPDVNRFIEVKGLYDKKSRLKMGIVAKTYPDVVFDLYDKDRLTNEGIFGIAKQLGINIEDFRYDLKKHDFYLKDLLNRVNQNDLIKEHILNKISIVRLSKNYVVPTPVMARAVYSKMPRIGTKEYYLYCFDRFFSAEQKNFVLSSPTINNAVAYCNNKLFKYKALYAIVKTARIA